MTHQVLYAQSADDDQRSQIQNQKERDLTPLSLDASARAPKAYLR